MTKGLVLDMYSGYEYMNSSCVGQLLSIVTGDVVIVPQVKARA
jgi:hypothetical protein